MSISISEMVSGLSVSQTILFFGAGSSIVSNAPTANELIKKLSTEYGIPDNGYTLREVACIIEGKASRRDLISSLRKYLGNLTPSGSVLNIPLYDWNGIYTTNYDRLIEQAFTYHGKPLQVFQSNFDFGASKVPNSMKLFKLHGSIEHDYSEGCQSRIVISDSDYDVTHEYREYLYQSLGFALSGSNMLIIGYSLSDDHIRQIVDKAISINTKAHIPAKILLLMYTRDEFRAGIFERRGIRVAFGGIDDFMYELEKQAKPKVEGNIETDNPLDKSPSLRTVTIDAKKDKDNGRKNAGAMFQGWPATYADIDSNLTFERTLVTEVVEKLQEDGVVSVTILGASGTGKSTLCRQVICKLMPQFDYCWEHKQDYPVLPDEWRKVGRWLHEHGKKGVLFIDNAHTHLYELNSLIDLLMAEGHFSLRFIVASPWNQWKPRVKTPNLYNKHGHEYTLARLDNAEIDKLLSLVDTNTDLQPLIGGSFQGFSRSERRRRLIVKCESETFVCLKNIFATESFDDIILREYAELDEDLQDIYKLVAALSHAGVIVHRQLVIRILQVEANEISSVLTRLSGIIHEYKINEREGIFGWKGRHSVIMGIIAEYKMSSKEKYRELLERVIDHLLPTYDIEVRTITQLCAFETGVNMFSDKHVRNILLRKMISVAPGERIPRHRLIRNLIEINEFEKAETEIRLFETDFGLDTPVRRYRVVLKLSRAERTDGILEEDRVKILEDAREEAHDLMNRDPLNRYVLKTYADVGVALFKRASDPSALLDALDRLRVAESQLEDPEVTHMIVRYERIHAAISENRSESDAETPTDLED